MKKTILLLIALVATTIASSAQQAYWVFLADKAGTTFDPYTYFDTKAIQRYNQCGADLYDLTNYPINQQYADQVDALATEEIGQSRWLNAIGVMATPEQAAAINNLPYVVRVQPINAQATLAAQTTHSSHSTDIASQDLDSTLTDQLIRMQGHLFRQKGIDGHGIRIAVFDGGFPAVNTHDAFKHLRDQGRILKTWNFPNRKENVYGWNSHGTSTLSCIAGRMNGKDIGLATGAEFLLARTEIEAEPFKEEVWWMQAVEWADRNGANIISSSLGYGKDRYYTKDMNGQSYVAHAGNLAARKGILVCNSAGNEGDDRSWRTIITPSDADSVLCIGGIEMDLDNYSHISFSSFGPSADGRQKPNVCAFAHTYAATPSSNSSYNDVYGTSFSCPLVAGFAACAWQASPGKTAMQMFDLIQRSADLYPYCDYSYGYGVPQASYFTEQHQTTTPTFRFERQSDTRVSLIPTTKLQKVNIFYKNQDANGLITRYGQRTVEDFAPDFSLDFEGGTQLTVNCGGYTQTYTFPKASDPASHWPTFGFGQSRTSITTSNSNDHTPANEHARERRIDYDLYILGGFPLNIASNETPTGLHSSCREGLRFSYHLSKAYAIGLGIEWGAAEYQFKKGQIHEVDHLVDMTNNINNLKEITHHNLQLDEISLELYQRIRFIPGGLMHKGLHWDLGLYGSYGYNKYILRGTLKNNTASSLQYILRNISPLSDYRWNFGLTTRLTYNYFGLFARYRLNNIGSDPEPGKILLPRLEIGFQVML